MVVRFDKDLAEILEVKEKASISKSSLFFECGCIFLMTSDEKFKFVKLLILGCGDVIDQSETYNSLFAY